MTLRTTLEYLIIISLISFAAGADGDNLDKLNVTTKQYQGTNGMNGYPNPGNGYNSNNMNNGMGANGLPNGYNNGNSNNNRPSNNYPRPNGNGFNNNLPNNQGTFSRPNGNNNGYGNNGAYGNGYGNNVQSNGQNNQNRRTFQSAREWNNDFMRRYQEVVAKIPQQAYDSYQQGQINAARRWANGMQNNYISRSEYYLNQSGYQPDAFMKAQEERLNTLGRTYFPLNWSGQRCGTAVYYNECGQYVNT